ncbi:hypothetical protein BH10ACT7_BH10ACT7_09340 [soil metagenome]
MHWLRGDITPGAVIVGLAGFLLGGTAMAFNPFFLTSVLAILLGILTLQNASRVRHPVAKGVLRILAIIGIMAALGGAVALAYPGLGVL